MHYENDATCDVTKQIEKMLRKRKTQMEAT